MSTTRFLPFLILSAAAHVAPWALWSDNGQQAAGDDGQQAITLAAAPASLGRIVEDWQKPVTVMSAAPSAASAAPPVMRQPAPSVSMAPALLVAQAPTLRPPARDARPKVDNRPTAPPKAAAKLVRKAAASAPRKAERAKGPGAASDQAGGGKAKTSAGTSTREASLLRQWGGAIRARIERQKRPAAAKGKVRLRVVAHSAGRLSSVKLVSSSGISALDAAALATVKRARLPRAPKGVATGNHGFSLTLTFHR